MTKVRERQSLVLQRRLTSWDVEFPHAPHTDMKNTHLSICQSTLCDCLWDRRDKVNPNAEKSELSALCIEIQWIRIWVPLPTEALCFSKKLHWVFSFWTDLHHHWGIPASSCSYKDACHLPGRKERLCPTFPFSQLTVPKMPLCSSLCPVLEKGGIGSFS